LRLVALLAKVSLLHLYCLLIAVPLERLLPLFIGFIMTAE